MKKPSSLVSTDPIVYERAEKKATQCSSIYYMPIFLNRNEGFFISILKDRRENRHRRKNRAWFKDKTKKTGLFSPVDTRLHGAKQ